MSWGWGHPAIDAAHAGAKTAVEKVKAIYDASKHYGTIAVAGHGHGENMAEAHIREALKDASPKEVKAALEEIGVKGGKGNKEKLVKQIIEKSKTRIGAVSRAAQGDLPHVSQKNANEELKKVGYKKPTNNSKQPAPNRSRRLLASLFK
jgi:hypothetical protein